MRQYPIFIVENLDLTLITFIYTGLVFALHEKCWYWVELRKAFKKYWGVCEISFRIFVGFSFSQQQAGRQTGKVSRQTRNVFIFALYLCVGHCAMPMQHIRNQNNQLLGKCWPLCLVAWRWFLFSFCFSSFQCQYYWVTMNNNELLY